MSKRTLSGLHSQIASIWCFRWHLILSGLRMLMEDWEFAVNHLCCTSSGTRKWDTNDHHACILWSLSLLVYPHLWCEIVCSAENSLWECRLLSGTTFRHGSRFSVYNLYRLLPWRTAYYSSLFEWRFRWAVPVLHRFLLCFKFVMAEVSPAEARVGSDSWSAMNSTHCTAVSFFTPISPTGIAPVACTDSKNVSGPEEIVNTHHI